MQKFMDFVKENFADVEIQRVYSGFPALDVPGAEGWKADDKETMREFQELNDAYGWKHIRLHTGQRFQLDELRFTVLFTYDDICEEPLTCYNDSSTILLLEAKGTKVVFGRFQCAFQRGTDGKIWPWHENRYSTGGPSWSE